jgi:hypothetical protein
MKKLFIYFSLFIFSFSLCSAQDTIVLKNGSKMAVKIVSVGDFVVFNQPPNQQDQRMDNSKIYYIKYADGSKYTINLPDVFTKNGSFIYTFKDTIHKLFSITTDLAQYLLLQPNVGMEYRINRLVTLGANFGWVEPSPIFAVNPLADGQFTDPGTVYTGYAIRFYGKLFLSRFQRSYFSVQGVYKAVSFNNVSFTDDYGDEATNTYTMSETAKVYGLEMLFGIETLGPRSYVDLDLFWGFGMHQRNRNYTISNATLGVNMVSGYGEPVAEDGNHTDILGLVTPIGGMRVGFNYIKKK